MRRHVPLFSYNHAIPRATTAGAVPSLHIALSHEDGPRGLSISCTVLALRDQGEARCRRLCRSSGLFKLPQVGSTSYAGSSWILSASPFNAGWMPQEDRPRVAADARLRHRLSDGLDGRSSGLLGRRQDGEVRHFLRRHGASAGMAQHRRQCLRGRPGMLQRPGRAPSPSSRCTRAEPSGGARTSARCSASPRRSSAVRSPQERTRSQLGGRGRSPSTYQTCVDASITVFKRMQEHDRSIGIRVHVRVASAGSHPDSALCEAVRCICDQSDGRHGIHSAGIGEVQRPAPVHRLLPEQAGHAQPPARRRCVPAASPDGDMQRSREQRTPAADSLGDPPQRRGRSGSGGVHRVAHDDAPRSGASPPLTP